MMASKMLVVLTINNNEDVLLVVLTVNNNDDDFHDDGCTHGERGGRESGEPQAAEKMALRCLQRNQNWVDHVGDNDNYYDDNDNDNDVFTFRHLQQ